MYVSSSASSMLLNLYDNLVLYILNLWTKYFI